VIWLFRIIGFSSGAHAIFVREWERTFLFSLSGVSVAVACKAAEILGFWRATQM
jgi:hypothetical protein